MQNHTKQYEQSCQTSDKHGSLLFDTFERSVIIKYNGKWGFQCPNYAQPIIRKYNMIKIKKEFVRFLKLEQIVLFISRHYVKPLL